MAIALEMLNFIVPIHLIEKNYPGGWAQCRRDYENCPGSWHDEHLFRLGAMNGMDMMLLLERWKELGFKAHYGGRKPTRWRELCIVDMFGTTLPCDWIIVDQEAGTASFKTTASARQSNTTKTTRKPR
ncbi:hypothetical protein HNR62_003152 [Oceanisphaera litoralis]|uniref:hypothetical protein n=1 Tax=Oceanisphaera litoralis TaxID=225144 RepID=UPI0019598ED7|nr:hypothetical protein [Oceanisphaera litoralis]MBM7457240.1 hypothetical protein [Oceanisphaera litoralis]